MLVLRFNEHGDELLFLKFSVHQKFTDLFSHSLVRRESQTSQLFEKILIELTDIFLVSNAHFHHFSLDFGVGVEAELDDELGIFGPNFFEEILEVGIVDHGLEGLQPHENNFR